MGTNGGDGSSWLIRLGRRGEIHGKGCLAAHATATAPGQARARTGCGRRSRTLESSGATYRSPAQHACEATHSPGWQRHLQHTSQDLQPAMAFLTRPARDVELVEELAQEFGALDGCKAAGGAANLHAGGWAD